MYLLGLEIRKDRREILPSTLPCYTCGRSVYLNKDTIRVYNYCRACAPTIH